MGPDPVSSLGFSVVAAPGDGLWLAVGHVSGALSVWELQKRGPRQVAGIGERGRQGWVGVEITGRAGGWVYAMLGCA